MTALMVLSALGCTLLGVFTLYVTWEKNVCARLGVPAGSALLVAAASLWIELLGPEYGLLYGLTVPSIMVGIVLAFNGDVRTRRDIPIIRGGGVMGMSGLKRHLITFVLTVPFAGLASVCISTGIAMSLPWQQANQWALAIFLLPVLWSIAVVWITIDSKLSRPLGVFLSGAALGTLGIYAG